MKFVMCNNVLELERERLSGGPAAKTLNIFFEGKMQKCSGLCDLWPKESFETLGPNPNNLKRLSTTYVCI